jgi:hypothetical protein
LSKHYIRLDNQNRIIKGFSDEFEQPLIADVCINEDGGRQFELNDIVNPSFINEKGIYIYKYDTGQVIERTVDEIHADEANLPIPPKIEEEILKEQLTTMQGALDFIIINY